MTLRNATEQILLVAYKDELTVQGQLSSTYKSVNNYIHNIFNALGVSLKEFKEKPKRQKYHFNDESNYAVTDTLKDILERKMIKNGKGGCHELPPTKRKIDKAITNPQTIDDFRERKDIADIINEFMKANFTHTIYRNLKNRVKKEVRKIADELENMGNYMQQVGHNIRNATNTYLITTDMLSNIINNNKYLGVHNRQCFGNILTEVSELLETDIFEIMQTAPDTPKGELSEYSLAILKLLRYSELLPAVLRQVKFVTRIGKIQENQ